MTWGGSTVSVVVGSTTCSITGVMADDVSSAVTLTVAAGGETVFILPQDQIVRFGNAVATLATAGPRSTDVQDTVPVALAGRSEAGIHRLSYSGTTVTLGAGTTILSGTLVQFKALVAGLLEVYVSVADNILGDRHARAGTRPRNLEAQPWADTMTRRWDL